MLNLAVHRESKAEVLFAAVGSFFIHLLIFALLFFWISVAGYAVMQQLSKTPEAEEQVILLTPDYFKREVPEEASPPRRRFTETNPATAEQDVEKASLIGERSTLGASETVLLEGDPTMPTQITREEREQELPNTFNSDFINGEIETPALPASEAQPEALSRPESKSETLSVDREEATGAESALPPPSQAPSVPLAQTPSQTEVLTETTAEARPDKVKNPTEDSKSPETAQSTEGENKNQRGTPQHSPKTTQSSAGFQTQQRKTRIVGSLSRDGKSSLEVQRTALGQYYAHISKIIERKWQQNCLQYRDLIQPGVISMRFIIDDAGKITGVKPHDVVSTSSIQVGFTMKAIRASQLPPMPEDVQSELDGEDLELIYNFYF